MKTQLAQVKLYLEREPRARERKNRYKAIRHLLINRYPLIIENHLTNEKLENIIFDSLAFNRSILRIQQLYENLRGSDYDEKDSKKILQQKRKIDLEYLPGYHQDNKKLKTIDNIVECDHECSSNCRRVGCNCKCGEYHLKP